MRIKVTKGYPIDQFCQSCGNDLKSDKDGRCLELEYYVHIQLCDICAYKLAKDILSARNFPPYLSYKEKLQEAQEVFDD